jgi:hypothetical protein
LDLPHDSVEGAVPLLNSDTAKPGKRNLFFCCLGLSLIDGGQADGVNLVAKGEQTPALGSGLMAKA